MQLRDDWRFNDIYLITRESNTYKHAWVVLLFITTHRNVDEETFKRALSKEWESESVFSPMRIECWHFYHAIEELEPSKHVKWHKRQLIKEWRGSIIVATILIGPAERQLTYIPRCPWFRWIYRYRLKDYSIPSRPLLPSLLPSPMLKHLLLYRNVDEGNV